MGRQGSCAADGSGINRMVHDVLVGLWVPSRHTCHPDLAFPSSQQASQIPLHILPAVFWLHRSCRLPTLQEPTKGGGELCPEPCEHRGRAPLPLTHTGAGRDYRSQNAASRLPPPIPGREQAGML